MIDTDKVARKTDRFPMSNKGFLCVVGAVAVFVAATSSLFFSAFTFSGVQGRSMEPSFSEGEHLLALKLDANYDPRRGDIVGFVADQVMLGAQDGELLKRVVGLPGDLVEIVDHQVFINGFLLDEPYAQWDYQSVPSRPEGFPQEIFDQAVENCVMGQCKVGTVKSWRVPEGHVFVLGDNRYGCVDSRSLGPVPVDSIRGRIVLKYWPLPVVSYFGQHHYGK